MHNSQNHLILKDWKKNRVAEGEIKKKIKKKEKIIFQLIVLCECDYSYLATL
jgi:hypothetical protein